MNPCLTKSSALSAGKNSTGESAPVAARWLMAQLFRRRLHLARRPGGGRRHPRLASFARQRILESHVVDRVSGDRTIEFREVGVITGERLETGGLRLGESKLRIEDIALHTGAHSH